MNTDETGSDRQSAGEQTAVLPETASQLVELESLTRPNRELVEDTFRVMSITFSFMDGPKTIDDFVKHRKPRPSTHRAPAPVVPSFAKEEWPPARHAARRGWFPSGH